MLGNAKMTGLERGHSGGVGKKGEYLLKAKIWEGKGEGSCETALSGRRGQKQTPPTPRKKLKVKQRGTWKELIVT